MNRPSTTSETNNGTSTKKAVFNYAAAVKRSSQIQDQPSSPTTTLANNNTSSVLATQPKSTNGSATLNSNGSTTPTTSSEQQSSAAAKEQHKNSNNTGSSSNTAAKSTPRNTVQLPRAPPTDAAPIQFGSINQDTDLPTQTSTTKLEETSTATGAPASPSGITFGSLSGTTMKYESQPFVPQQRGDSVQPIHSDSQQQQGYNNNNNSRHYSGQRHHYNPNKHSPNMTNAQSGSYIHTKKSMSPLMGSSPSPNQHMAHGWGSPAPGHIPPQSYYHARPPYDAQRAYYGYDGAAMPMTGPPQHCVVPPPKKPIAIIDPNTGAEVPIGNKVVASAPAAAKDTEKPIAPPKVGSKAIPIINPNKERLAREEAERKAKEEAELKAKEEAELKAKEEAELKAKEEAELKVKEEAERKAKEEEERKAKEEADRKAEEERKAKEEADRKAEEERKAKIEADRKAEEERKAKEEAELKAEQERKAEEERKAKEEADRKAEEERKAKEDADRKTEEERKTKEEAERKEKEAVATVATEIKAEETPASQDESKKVPERLDLSNISSSPSTSVQAVKPVARVTRLIEELNAVDYPEEVKGPFGFQDKNGHIKYDSKFLLQFQHLCKETSIDTSIFQEYNSDQSDRSGSRTNSRRQGSERGRGPRTPVGGEMGMFRHGSKDGRMEMGKFAGGRPLTHRTGSGRDSLPSPGGMQREGSRNRSGRGGKRHAGKGDDKREERQQVGAPTIAPEDVAPLEMSQNRWVPLAVRKQLEAQAAEEEERMSDELIIRKVKGLLNKLTLEKFDSISDQIWSYAEQSTKEEDGRALRIVIQLTFDKACDEAAFSAMWAQLCEKLCNNMTDDIKDVSIKDKEGQTVSGAHLFRKYLLNRCQSDFERGWKFNLPEVDESQPDLLTDEYYAAVKAKRHGLGLVQFIGELFKRRMLTDRIMMQCFSRLCANPKEVGDEETETMCKLMTTVGKHLDIKATRGFVDAYFSRMQEMLESPTLSSRVRFMIMDVFDLRKNKWASRRGANIGPTTIAEIHEQAQKAKEEQKEAMKRTTSSRGNLPHPMPRTGSHRGAGARDLHRENSSAGPSGNKDSVSKSGDGWNTVSGSSGNPSGTTKGSRVNELANFGKTDRSKTRSSVLGPSNSPFASLNRVNSKAGDQKSASNDERSSNMNNMFSALGGETDDHDHDHDYDHDNDGAEEPSTEHEDEEAEPSMTPAPDSKTD